METRLNEVNVQELTIEEAAELEGGSERKDTKQSAWLDSLWGWLTP